VQYGLNYKDSSHQLLNLQDTGYLIRNNPGQVILIASQEEYSRWQPFLPSPVSIAFFIFFTSST
jgi:hypothetical protein